MAKKSKKQTRSGVVNDLRESLEDMRRLARGEEAGAVVHLVVPSKTKARRAARLLGIIKQKPKASPLRAKAKAAR